MTRKTKTVKFQLLAALLLVTILFFSNSLVKAQQTRKESDLLGEKEIPINAYYGVQTARALENFHGERGNHPVLS